MSLAPESFDLGFRSRDQYVAVTPNTMQCTCSRPKIYRPKVILYDVFARRACRNGKRVYIECPLLKGNEKLCARVGEPGTACVGLRGSGSVLVLGVGGGSKRLEPSTSQFFNGSQYFHVV